MCKGLPGRVAPPVDDRRRQRAPGRVDQSAAHRDRRSNRHRGQPFRTLSGARHGRVACVRRPGRRAASRAGAAGRAGQAEARPRGPPARRGRSRRSVSVAAARQRARRARLLALDDLQQKHDASIKARILGQQPFDLAVAQIGDSVTRPPRSESATALVRRRAASAPRKAAADAGCRRADRRRR